MVFWVISAILTVGLVIVLARPLARRGNSEPASASAVRIYKDQLTEIAADQARGLIGREEAEAARIEVSRRLLAASASEDESGLTGRGTGEVSSRLLIRGMALALPLSAIGLYLALGAPMVPDQPFASRSTPQQGDARVADLIERVEKRLRDHPEDGQGWDVIAPIYLRQERYQEAAFAFARAIDLVGETPKRLTGLGEALVFQHGGVVTDEARRAWVRLAEVSPGQPEALFWLAMADEQDGRFAAAAEAYRSLLAASPADAPWRMTVQGRLTIVARRLASVSPQDRAVSPTASEPSPQAERKSAFGVPRGPTAADVTAAQSMSPADRQQMIEQMVASLAERLKANGTDAEGWERLIRSYAVLGRSEDAKQALGAGRKALEKDPAGLQRLDAVAKSLQFEG
jgi:cytochrome c-type biogenesis protein CcmH